MLGAPLQARLPAPRVLYTLPPPAMRPLCAPKKRSSTPKRKPAKRGKRAKRAKRKVVKKKRSRSKKSRSAAAKKGWAKRRKQQKLLEAIQDARERRSDQPLGWITRRAEVRIMNGKVWRQIAVEYSESEYQAKRLAALADLKMDLLTRDELYDHLVWMSEQFDIDLGDLYEMYLGYKTKEE